ncbi:hypothetical protein [Candidatus Phytoplasma meliae]|uniref:Uncharacterized protein n=1 Tax=Candidatus Phytoplasma meliae TaxID=1848402 RepID=A0ABS5CYK9_9MOLU|nr:hypothetical protein [Candidatus Phytoplasma meliae]MBP5836061.1 hypothetical protein [Candidatus Phytoplasma meliae]
MSQSVYGFNPNDYEKDSSSYHKREEWKHEGGTFLSSDAKVFYNIKGVQMVPCKTYQEWFNKQQSVEDGASIVLNFFPVVGGIVNSIYKEAAKPLLNKLVVPNGDKIAMLNEAVRYSLKLNHGRGVFFFNDYDLNNIDRVDITFCNCDMSSTDDAMIEQLEQLIETFQEKDVFNSELYDNLETENVSNNPEEKLKFEMFMKELQNKTEEIFNNSLEKLISEIKNSQKTKIFVPMTIEEKTAVSEKTLKVIKDEIQRRIVKNINKKVGHAIAKKAWKKVTKKTVGSVFGKIFVPGIEMGIDKAEKKIASEHYITNIISFSIKNNSYEKTIGFDIDFPSENEIAVYEIRKNNYVKQTSALVKKTNIYDSTHMLIDILTQKNSSDTSKFISVYNGKLK